MACFADINVSQGSVATYARCGGIFNIFLAANLPRNLQVKKFLISVKNCQNYGHESVAHPVYLDVRDVQSQLQQIILKSCSRKMAGGLPELAYYQPNPA